MSCWTKLCFKDTKQSLDVEKSQSKILLLKIIKQEMKLLEAGKTDKCRFRKSIFLLCLYMSIGAGFATGHLITHRWWQDEKSRKLPGFHTKPIKKYLLLLVTFHSESVFYSFSVWNAKISKLLIKLWKKDSRASLSSLARKNCIIQVQKPIKKSAKTERISNFEIF